MLILMNFAHKFFLVEKSEVEDNEMEDSEVEAVRWIGSTAKKYASCYLRF